MLNTPTQPSETFEPNHYASTINNLELRKKIGEYIQDAISKSFKDEEFLSMVKLSVQEYETNPTALIHNLIQNITKILKMENASNPEHVNYDDYKLNEKLAKEFPEQTILEELQTYFRLFPIKKTRDPELTIQLSKQIATKLKLNIQIN